MPDHRIVAAWEADADALRDLRLQVIAMTDRVATRALAHGERQLASDARHDGDLCTATLWGVEVVARRAAERARGDSTPGPCGRGPCAAAAGHDGSCAEASGWSE